MLDTIVNIISILFVPANSNLRYEVVSYFFGYIYSMVIGHIFISNLMEPLSKLISKKEKTGNLYQPRMVGVLERFIYTSLILLGKDIFIAVWIALKIAGNWKLWEAESKEGGKTVSGYNTFNVFLIGTGFSVVYGVLGGLLIKWLLREQFILATYFSIFVILFTVFFLAWANRVNKINHLD